jgi:hypothetical protein
LKVPSSRTVQSIDFPVLHAFKFDQPGLSQVSEVLGSIDLWQIQYFLDMADAKRLLKQQIQDSQTRWIREGFIDFS